MMDLDRVNNYLARVEESEKTTFKPVGSRLKVGVDLGTAYIVLVVLDEENNPVACEKQNPYPQALVAPPLAVTRFAKSPKPTLYGSAIYINRDPPILSLPTKPTLARNFKKLTTDFKGRKNFSSLITQPIEPAGK